ncbi:hypothetical protein ACFSR7_14475 [Cohnella sp. GCM10020058]|uniref:hypothetical protein n=1 Tax=Cohnella sp. GCM10020058 TaxID=3317330 RepID=UPI00363995A7
MAATYFGGMGGTARNNDVAASYFGRIGVTARNNDVTASYFGRIGVTARNNDVAASYLGGIGGTLRNNDMAASYFGGKGGTNPANCGEDAILPKSQQAHVLSLLAIFRFKLFVQPSVVLPPKKLLPVKASAR